mgnify:CR=1 FL=1
MQLKQTELFGKWVEPKLGAAPLGSRPEIALLAAVGELEPAPFPTQHRAGGSRLRRSVRNGENSLLIVAGELTAAGSGHHLRVGHR